jgi:hypothetical protein
MEVLSTNRPWLEFGFLSNSHAGTTISHQNEHERNSKQRTTARH